MSATPRGIGDAVAEHFLEVPDGFGQQRTGAGWLLIGLRRAHEPQHAVGVTVFRVEPERGGRLRAAGSICP